MVRIAPSGGRTRRKGGAISLAGADVPIVTPARDPGLNVPLIPIPGGEMGGVIGEGLQSLGNVLDQGANLALQVVQRDEGLARDADETSYSDTLQDTIRDLQKTADLSDSALVEAAGEKMFQEKMRILSEHKGGKISSTLLDNRLTKMHNRFADTLAVININAADTRLNLAVDRKISSIARDVLTDPDVLMSEDPLESFRFHTGQLEEEIDFLELRPDQARIVRQVGRSEIALSMITPLIKNGQFERAKVLLRSDEIAEVLSPGQHRDAIQRVIDAERKSVEVKNEGQEFLNTARTILGPTATDDDVRDAAAQMAGMEQDGGFKIVDVGGGKVVAVNEDTLEVQTLVSGPTEDEKVALESRLENARLIARKDVMSSMAVDAGLGQLFGVAPTEPVSGEGEKSKPAAPTATEKEGAPAGPEVVPPLSEEAVSTPFGPEEEPASSDMQSVLGLMALSRRFFLIGDNVSANGLLSQARMIVDNSREIQEQRELDKPITNVEMLRELGLPLGATMRQGAGRMLQSAEQLQSVRQKGERITLDEAREFQVPTTINRGELEAIQRDRERSGAGSAVPRTFEEKAQAGSLASARGRNQAQAEVQMRFVFETHQQVTDILEEIKDDPTLVGTVGAMRATGRTALTLLADLGFDNFVDAARDIASDQSDLGADEIFDFFDDPLLSALDLLSNSIGINRARLRNPIGRVPVEIIKRSIKDSDLTKFGGSEKIIDVLNRVLKDELGRRRNVLKKQFPGMFDPFEDGGEISEEQVIPPGIPEFRLEGGKFVPVIPDEASGGGSPEIPFKGEVEQDEIDKARLEAEERFPFIKQFSQVQVAPSTVQNKGGLGEFVEPDSPDNPLPGQFTITIGEGSRGLQGGVADTVVADMVHAAAEFSPEFQSLKKKLVKSFSKSELELARRRYNDDFKGKFTGSNFSTFENFLESFWTEGMVQHLLLPENSEIGSIQKNNPKAVPILNDIEALFKREPVSPTDSSGEISGSEGVDELRGEAPNASLETILVSNASGESTVDETVAAVDQLFGGGEFLKRVAKVESNFGADKGTFRKRGDRGIWQLNQKTGFEATKDVKAHPGLKKAHEKIREEFGIDWNEVSFEDLGKPLISALAARLFLLTIPEKIPDTLEGQAVYWKKHYNTVKGKGTTKKFIEDNSIEVEG